MQANYHMTENKFLGDILNNGLIPQKGKRSNLIGDSKCAIFYSKGYEGAIAMFFMMIERFIEYRGIEGDIHIDSYKTVIKMANKKQQKGMEISETLKSTISREREIVKAINEARSASDYKKFLGDGVYLKFNNTQEYDSNLPEFNFYNSWITSTIPPEDIYVIVLKDKETGDEVTSKYSVINYFISKTPLDKMKKLLYDTDEKEGKRESHLLWKIMSKYYSDNEDYIRAFEKYDIIEIPLKRYLNREEEMSKESEINER